MNTFRAQLHRPPGTGTWTFVNIPFDVEGEFGVKTRVPIKGTINELPFRSSLMPQGAGRYILVVNSEIRAQLGVEAGDSVEVSLERDNDVRTVEVPDDFAAELDLHDEAHAVYRQFSYSQQKEYVAWIESAKKADTRAARIEKAVVRLAEGKPLK